MKNVLDLNNINAREFFLKAENYCALDLPEYFCFQKLLIDLSKELDGKQMKECGTRTKPNNIEDINYTLLNNKDGAFAWRPFQLIHPAIYVFIVHEITKDENWKLIKSRFLKFANNSSIECHSIPISEENDKSNKQNQIYEWWQKVEQESLILALEYNHLLHLDLTDCYGSIYTHSITWALHTKVEAKKKEIRDNSHYIGVYIDKQIQSMSYGQTNGIPQGSVLMDFIAEVVLGYGDLLISKELEKHCITDYKIIRYRDDYRIFTKDQETSYEIAKVVSEILSTLNFKINSSKTLSTNDIILGSLKQDKVHWIYNKSKTGNIQRWLIQLYILGNKHPNSGSLFNETKLFLEWLEKKEKSEKGLHIQNTEVLVSILVNLAFNNPRLFTLVTASLSFIISSIEDENEQKILLQKIKNKFNQLPNTGYLNIWLQRITLKTDCTIIYPEKLCQKILDENVHIWNSDWLSPKYKKIVDDAVIINKDVLKKVETRLSEIELEQIKTSQDYAAADFFTDLEDSRFGSSDNI